MRHVEPQQPVRFHGLIVSAQSSSTHLRSALLSSGTEHYLLHDDAVMTVLMSVQYTGNLAVPPCISPDSSVTAP